MRKLASSQRKTADGCAQGMRALVLGAAGLLAACAVPPGNSGLDQARGRYPALIVGANTTVVTGTPPAVRSCPAAGGRVEQSGGPAFEYLGTDPASLDLCRVRLGTDVVRGWYGIWLTDWPGADLARPALGRLMQGNTGDVEAFDVVMGPGLQYHDLIRNEGIEAIPLLGKTYRAIKLSHYREGFGGNSYRSVSTVWKDVDSGLLVYGTYQHISGAPVIDDPLLPTAILPATR